MTVEVYVVFVGQFVGLLDLLINFSLPFFDFGVDNRRIHYELGQVLYIDYFQHLLIAACFDNRLLKLISQ